MYFHGLGNFKRRPFHAPAPIWSLMFVCFCWGFTAQSTQWGHVERGHTESSIISMDHNSRLIYEALPGGGGTCSPVPFSFRLVPLFPWNKWPYSPVPQNSWDGLIYCAAIGTATTGWFTVFSKWTPSKLTADSLCTNVLLLFCSSISSHFTLCTSVLELAIWYMAYLFGLSSWSPV